MQTLTEYKNNLLKNHVEAASYLNAALAEYTLDSNRALLMIALKDIINAQGGVSQVAKIAQISRQHVYKMLSNNGNPTLDKFGSLLSVLGMKLVVQQ